MALDPLVSAFLGNQTAEYGNPAMASALPRMRLVQAMMQSGIDASPVQHPLQAVARVAQAGAGSLMQRSALSDLAKAYTGQATALADAFKDVPGSEALVAALRNPATAPIALQTAGKALTSLPEQAFERQKFYMQYAKPDFGPVGTELTTGLPQYGFRYPTQGKVVPYNAPSAGGNEQTLPRASSEEEFNAIASGQRYIAPDGSVRVKP